MIREARARRQYLLQCCVIHLLLLLDVYSWGAAISDGRTDNFAHDRADLHVEVDGMFNGSARLFLALDSFLMVRETSTCL